jgi:hypothetical protein
VAEPVDPEFYSRADSFIHVANEHCGKTGRGKVSASFMYAVARFNSWVSACGFESASQMTEAKRDTIEYFVKEYRAMLEENLDDYIENFARYMEKK